MLQKYELRSARMNNETMSVYSIFQNQCRKDSHPSKRSCHKICTKSATPWTLESDVPFSTAREIQNAHPCSGGLPRLPRNRDSEALTMDDCGS